MTPLSNAVTGTESAAVDFKMPAPGDQGYDEWRKTGKLPELQEAEPAEKHPEEKHEEVQEHELGSLEAEESATSESVTRAASEAARPQKGKKPSAEERKTQLSAEIRELANTAADLRRAIAEARTQTPASRDTKQEAQPAAEVKAEAGKALPEPQLDDKNADGSSKFKLYGEYQKAWSKWSHDESVRLALAAVTEHTTKTQAEQRTAEAQKVIDQSWGEKVQKVREKYPDFDATVKNLLKATDRNGKEFFLPRGSAIDQFLLESPHGAEVFHYLAEHCNEEIVQHIFERTPDGKYFILNPVQQVLALDAIGRQFDAAPAPKPKATSAIPVTQAPRPPHQVTGKASVTLDEAEQAVKEGDQEAFTRIENEKALGKLRQGRRRA